MLEFQTNLVQGLIITGNPATNVITCARLRLKANVATDEGKDRNEM